MKFKVTLKDLSRYKNTGERTVVVKATNRYWATDVATKEFKGYEIVGFEEITEEEI
jgi:hypothetical protein